MGDFLPVMLFVMDQQIIMQVPRLDFSLCVEVSTFQIKNIFCEISKDSIKLSCVWLVLRFELPTLCTIQLAGQVAYIL